VPDFPDKSEGHERCQDSVLPTKQASKQAPCSVHARTPAVLCEPGCAQAELAGALSLEAEAMMKLSLKQSPPEVMLRALPVSELGQKHTDTNEQAC
jgi:hypothetical protein